jgi:hypothetical protein
MTHSHLKTVTVPNEAVFGGPIVIPKHLFVKVTEQVERFDVHVGAFQGGWAILAERENWKRKVKSAPFEEQNPKRMRQPRSPH